MSKISINDVSKRFEEHLQITDNFRIIFSGPFGVGKTYFLNEYFKERKEEYNTFLLSPVNYVVSNNEDIFELIKADIIKDLFITGKIDLTKLPEDNTLQKISNYVESKQAVIGNFMLKFISKLTTSSETPKKVIDGIGSIYENYRKESKGKKREEMTRSEELIEHLDSIEEKIGNIYEHNYITKVINTFLEELREKKKNVLIIDDLDRIDPEHIFRILNILSVHNNYFESENKFAFDHVILVCDLENIAKIYVHRYGANVDFEGYIDKFYSTHLFYFTNIDAIVTYVKTIVGRKEGENSYIDFLVLMLKNFVEHNQLSVRKLLKHTYKGSVTNFTLYSQRGVQEDTFYLFQGVEFLNNSSNLYVDSRDLQILQFFKLATFIFGNFNNFLNSLNEVKKSSKLIEYKDCKDILSFLALENHIACKTGDDIFFTKQREHHPGGAAFLRELGWPQTSFQGIDYKIILKWTAGNKYNSDETYFKEARAHPRGEDVETRVKISAICQAVEDIASFCFEKGYLDKSGIFLLK